MNRFDNLNSDENLALFLSRTCEVPAKVETRLARRFSEFHDRLTMRPGQPGGRASVAKMRTLRWATGMAVSAAILIFLVAWLGSRSDTWAEVVEHMRSTPWIHARCKFQQESGEYWISLSRGVWAARFGDSDYVTYCSRESSTRLTYRSDDGELVRHPTTQIDEEMLGQMDVLFTRMFRGAAGADLSTSTERLVKQRTSEVEIDGKRWLEFELTFRSMGGDHERSVVYLVDPHTRLPKSCVYKPQFADDPTCEIEFNYPQSGPADIFALNVPRDAQVVDGVPVPELAKILEGHRVGREKMDDYSGLIVQGLTSYHWSEASAVWRVWRSGKKWRIEQAGVDVPGPLQRSMLGDDATPRPTEAVDRRAWWKAAAEKIHFFPVLVSDGKMCYFFDVKAEPEVIKSREDYDKLRYEIESVTPVSPPAADLGASAGMLPEYMARPPMGIPSADRQATLNANPMKGPEASLLVSVHSRKPQRSTGQRVWFDPQRDYIAIRQELDIGRNSQGNPQFQVSVIDEAAQSPRGVWYPCVMRSLAISDEIGKEIGDQLAGITRYYLDFDAPFPPKVFSIAAFHQIESRPRSTAPPPRTATQAAQRAWSSDNLRAIGTALRSYSIEMEHLHFPAARIFGPDGKTPHSWRVAILPHLGHKNLFDEYDLEEAWDSENNLKVLEKMPDVFRGARDSKGTNAAFFLLTGEATLFPSDKPLGPQDIVDGAAHTLLAVEAKRDVPWTKPEDIRVEENKPLPELGGFDPDGFCVIFADGSLRFIERRKYDDAKTRAWITPADNEKVKRPD